MTKSTIVWPKGRTMVEVTIGHAVVPGVHITPVKSGKTEYLLECRMKRIPVSYLIAWERDDFYVHLATLQKHHGVRKTISESIGQTGVGQACLRRVSFRRVGYCLRIPGSTLSTIRLLTESSRLFGGLWATNLFQFRRHNKSNRF